MTTTTTTMNDDILQFMK